jgi:hypothetical protein
MRDGRSSYSPWAPELQALRFNNAASSYRTLNLPKWMRESSLAVCWIQCTYRCQRSFLHSRRHVQTVTPAVTPDREIAGELNLILMTSFIQKGHRPGCRLQEPSCPRRLARKRMPSAVPLRKHASSKSSASRRHGTLVMSRYFEGCPFLLPARSSHSRSGTAAQAVGLKQAGSKALHSIL